MGVSTVSATLRDPFLQLRATMGSTDKMSVLPEIPCRKSTRESFGLWQGHTEEEPWLGWEEAWLGREEPRLGLEEASLPSGHAAL